MRHLPRGGGRRRIWGGADERREPTDPGQIRGDAGQGGEGPGLAAGGRRGGEGPTTGGRREAADPGRRGGSTGGSERERGQGEGARVSGGNKERVAVGV